ncbi:MAG: LUD domain-containing protein, partial [Bacteroidia bacterium]|nr:LUD domain-containing protein [Bacteroidia bacterium]
MAKATTKPHLADSFKNKAAIKRRKEFDANFQSSFNNSTAAYKHFEDAKKQAAYIKWKAIENLETLLTDFESKARLNGITVHWAPSARDAKDQIVSIATQNKVKRITQTGYTALNELRLHEALTEANIDLATADASNYLNAQEQKTPAHPFFGSFNLSEKEITENLHDKSLGGLQSAESEQYENIKSIIDAKFKIADAHLCAANFICADTGDICVVDTEGGALKGLSKTKTNIIVAGIDTVIPSINNIEIFTHLLALYGVAKPNAVYTKLLRRNREAKNKNTHIILLDDGRTEKLKDPEYRSLLHCINCGACYQVCPLVKTSGTE